MKNSTISPPQLALLLLELALPEPLNDEIAGDLYEEFMNTNSPKHKRKIWFWWQTLCVITRVRMNCRNLLTAALVVFSTLIFAMLTGAILFISNAVDDVLFAKSYWTDGNVHLFFIEQVYWQHFGRVAQDFSIQMFINIPAMVWSAVAIGTLITVHKTRVLPPLYFAGLSLLLIIAPYIYGVFVFISNDVALRQSGPIIAVMWLSIWYMVLPVCYLITRQFRQAHYFFRSQ